ncbi:MAG: Cytidine deaminase [Verrucomicrobiae bacterium]|nr:Cytidine deaminase [Verrucomicrobiae bacterium]
MTKKLLAAAKTAQRRAYAPYSKFSVGAALLTKSGAIYTGCNVENASYGLTICAERVAITKAVSEGHRKFQAIAIVCPGTQPTPCGACRQFLAEFGDLIVIYADSRNLRLNQTYRLAELLPHAFEL